MTVAVAWTRSISSCEELIFVTDSRLSGDGCNFDACPKVLTLPRTDCAIAFAGYSGHAYPMMQQLALAIDAHAPARRRTLGLASLRSHALKIFDSLADQIRVSPYLSGAGICEPDADFIFGGYDWIEKSFKIWTIKYDPAIKKFTSHPSQTLVHRPDLERVVLSRARKPRHGHPLGRVTFAGDQGALARKNLLAHFAGARKTAPRPLDWQPFEIVRDMLRDPRRSETIGGSPQIVKVYQYMEATPQGVYWPSKEAGTVHLQGRARLNYERIDHYVLDPDNLQSEPLAYATPVEGELID